MGSTNRGSIRREKERLRKSKAAAKREKRLSRRRAKKENMTSSSLNDGKFI
jgi:hypothetical protein